MVKWGEEFRETSSQSEDRCLCRRCRERVVDALAGIADLGMVSREISPEEVKRGAFFIPVVKDAVFPMMNDRNSILKKGPLRERCKETDLHRSLDTRQSSNMGRCGWHSIKR